MLTELLYYALAIARTAASSIQGSDGIVPYIGNTSRTPGTESATQLNQHRVSDFPARWPPWFRFLLFFVLLEAWNLKIRKPRVGVCRTAQCAPSGAVQLTVRSGG